MVGGYDEDYCGNKGWSDVQLLHVFNSAFKVRIRKDILVTYWQPGDGVDDCMVTSIDRSVGKNANLHRSIAKKVSRSFGGDWFQWTKSRKKKTLRFPWKKLI